MDTEQLRDFCLGLPHVSEEIKWKHDLCFMLGKRFFCVTWLNEPFNAIFKVRANEFDELVVRPYIQAAPFWGKHKWVQVISPTALSAEEWEHYIQQSYDLVWAKLTKKERQQLEN